MTEFTLGQATAVALARVRVGKPARSGAPHLTDAPVLRDSIEAGTFEEHFFSVPARGEGDRLLRTARAAWDAGRRLKRTARVEGRELTPAERALAAITAGAVRVYEELCTLARLNEGRVFPTYEWLAQATALGRATVARALTALERAGFLVRQRRFKRVEGAARRYAQTSNAYRPTLPARVAALLPRWLHPVPVPPCALQHEAERAEDLAVMRAQLSCRELAETIAGGALGGALARLGARIDAGRESHDDPQPLLDSIFPGTDTESGWSTNTRHRDDTIGHPPGENPVSTPGSVGPAVAILPGGTERLPTSSHLRASVPAETRRPLALSACQQVEV